MVRAHSLMLPLTLVVCLICAWIGMTALRPMLKSTGSTGSASGATTAIPATVRSGTSGSSQAGGQGKAQTTCALSTSFPQAIRQWCTDIQTYASKEGVDAALIAAVMWQESGGNPQAYSASGAVGLLQVMPSDGLAASFMCASGPCFANRPTTAQLLDPQFNITYGTGMLGNLIKKYGSVREALRAYGPEDMGYSYADRVMQIWYNYK